VSFGEEIVWAPEPLWKVWRREKYFALPVTELQLLAIPTEFFQVEKPFDQFSRRTPLDAVGFEMFEFHHIFFELNAVWLKSCHRIFSRSFRKTSSTKHNILYLIITLLFIMFCFFLSKKFVTI
jgi:hypothetical protein